MSTQDIPPDLLARARDICLSLPEAVEIETWGHPTFRIRKKMFATMGAGDDGFTTMSMKALDQQGLLAVGHPFFKPAYVGDKGWIGIVIDHDTDWSEVDELVTDSFIAIAPKTVGRLVEQALEDG